MDGEVYMVATIEQENLTIRTKYLDFVPRITF